MGLFDFLDKHKKARLNLKSEIVRYQRMFDAEVTNLKHIENCSESKFEVIKKIEPLWSSKWVAGRELMDKNCAGLVSRQLAFGQDLLHMLEDENSHLEVFFSEYEAANLRPSIKKDVRNQIIGCLKEQANALQTKLQPIVDNLICQKSLLKKSKDFKKDFPELKELLAEEIKLSRGLENFIPEAQKIIVQLHSSLEHESLKERTNIQEQLKQLEWRLKQAQLPGEKMAELRERLAYCEDLIGKIDRLLQQCKDMFYDPASAQYLAKSLETLKQSTLKISENFRALLELRQAALAAINSNDQEALLSLMPKIFHVDASGVKFVCHAVQDTRKAPDGSVTHGSGKLHPLEYVTLIERILAEGIKPSERESHPYSDNELKGNYFYEWYSEGGTLGHLWGWAVMVMPTDGFAVFEGRGMRDKEYIIYANQIRAKFQLYLDQRIRYEHAALCMTELRKRNMRFRIIDEKGRVKD